MTNLAIDIGNTCTKLVAFSDTSPLEELRIDDGEEHLLADFATKYMFDRGIYSTVVHLTPKMENAIKSFTFPMIRLVPGKTPVPLAIRYLTPHTLGADRLAAAVGAYCRHPGREVMVIDVGTCITYDFVNDLGEYFGGNISPGPAIRLKALNTFTDSLPLIERKGEIPELGNSTETAIRSGVMNGIRREIEGYISDYLLKYPRLLIYLTGGIHPDLHVKEKMRTFADDFIVPEGLNRILLYNIE